MQIMARVGDGQQIELLCARCGDVLASLDAATVNDHGSHRKPTGGVADTERIEHRERRCVTRQQRAAKTAGRLPAPPRGAQRSDLAGTPAGSPRRNGWRGREALNGDG